MDANTIREIVADELRNCIGYYVKELFIWIVMAICIVFPIWYSIKKDESSSFSYCPAEKPATEPDIKIIMEAVKKFEKDTKKKEVDTVAEDKFLADCGSFTDAAVKEKVEQIQKKRIKTEEADA